MYKNKISKMLFGIIIFMLASVNVFAAKGSLDYKESSKQLCYKAEASINKISDISIDIDGIDDIYIVLQKNGTYNEQKDKNGKVVSVDGCVSLSAWGKHINKSSYYNAKLYVLLEKTGKASILAEEKVYIESTKAESKEEWTSKSLSTTVNTSIKLTGDTSWCSFSDSAQGQMSATNATLSTSGHACYFKATKAGTYTAYDIYQGKTKYKYTITVTGTGSGGSGGSGSGGSGGSGSGGGNKITTYSVSFNENGGYGLTCDDESWYVPSTGICKKDNINSGKEISVPKVSKEMYDISNPSFKLIGWTKTNCNKGNVIKDSSVKVTSTSEYKACYREDIGGNRYLQNGFIADGEPSKFKCGDSAFIEYCTRESSGEYCYMFEGGKYRKIYRDKIAENTDSGLAAAKASCGISSTSNEQKNINKYMYALTNGSDFKCGEALYVTTCVGNTCTFNKISKFDKSVINVDNKTINYEDLTSNSNDAKKTCEKINIDVDDNGCNNQTDSDNKGEGSYTVCYPYGASKNKIIDEIKSYYYCADDYIIDESSIYSEDEEESCNDKNTVCSRTYNVTCVRSEGKYKPTVEVKSGNVGSDGTGNITVYANSKEGRIVQYYASPIYKAPTETTLEWVDVNSDTFTINSTPGVMYIWVKDINGNVSHGIGGAVFDTINLNTTVNDMSFKDSNGGILSPTGNTAYKLEGITDSSYVRLSNSLVNESVIAENGFNPFTMEYKLEVDAPTISVYATLTSTDSNYVNGYEPRTVNLDYGMNTILIKIQNKEGKVRTYTILVNRVDSRTADNTLSDLSIDVGKIDFNTNKTEYKIEIPTDTEKVNVNATIGDDNASFVDGYRPGVVNINGDTTVSFIKVKSETGSTRTYVLTFIKEGTDEIKKKNLMISDLVIPGVYVAFEEEIVNYNISVAYETELINLNYDLKDKDSSATVYFKGKNDSDYRISSNQGIKLDVGENFVEIKIINEDGEESYYRLTIIRKEFGLGISNDTTLKDLSVLGYDINYEPNKKEYVVKIKQEKSLVITAIPNNNRAEVFIRGNDELTGFSTVRVKVVAENGEFDTYSIDIKKDAFNKTIEIAAIIAGVVIILGSSCIIVIKNKNKKKKEYYEE